MTPASAASVRNVIGRGARAVLVSGPAQFAQSDVPIIEDRSGGLVLTVLGLLGIALLCVVLAGVYFWVTGRNAQYRALDGHGGGVASLGIVQGLLHRGERVPSQPQSSTIENPPGWPPVMPALDATAADLAVEPVPPIPELLGAIATTSESPAPPPPAPVAAAIPAAAVAPVSPVRLDPPAPVSVAPAAFELIAPVVSDPAPPIPAVQAPPYIPEPMGQRTPVQQPVAAPAPNRPEPVTAPEPIAEPVPTEQAPVTRRRGRPDIPQW